MSTASRVDEVTPEGSTIHGLLRAQAERTPDRVAIEADGRELTFAELDLRSDALAEMLCAHGVASEELVGICLPRSVDMVVAVIGILKAGAAYLPLDPGTLNPGGRRYPSERLSFMVTDSGIRVLVTDRALAAGLPEELGSTQLVHVDDIADITSARTSLGSDASPRDLAYGIYTSGSTGRPKAVLVEHAAALNLLSGLRSSVYGDRASDPMRVTANAPLGFDPSVQQLLMLLDGHTVVVVPENIRANGRALLAFLEQRHVDVLDTTPSQLRLLAENGLFDHERRWPTVVLCGGEAFDAQTWRAAAAARWLAVYNLYGPTECTVDSTVARVEGDQLTIGRPLPNVGVWILDEALVPVPTGTPGEIFITGAGVARGYHNRPELTAERFIEVPGVETRLYRTGDLGRCRSDGQMEYLGRTDDQVKLRSYRIELSEVESVLREHPGVADAAVALQRGDVDRDSRLVAYYVANRGVGVSTSELREHLVAWLPEYMVPAAFVPIGVIPLTANGKVDRAALPEPSDERPLLSADLLSPRDEAQSVVARTWAEVINLRPDHIGIEDNFWDLGGNSLRAVGVITALEDAFGVELPLDFVFENPTVATQAAAIATSPALLTSAP